MGQKKRPLFLLGFRADGASALKAWSIFLVLAALLVWALPLDAKVFSTRDEALARAFPGLDIKKETVFLKDPDLDEIEKASGVRPGSKLFTYYAARGKGGIEGYAVIESHVVRTKPEAYMAVISPGGELRYVEILAFYEPLEYIPSKRWLDQFRGKRLSESLWINRDIQAITGATLTAFGLTREVRKTLAAIGLVVPGG
ncbi:MAG: FMN-binding protein [Deltaproteobacteria bacterium]|nr:FMN-binding protein [Deltaproteobacteria bacterium]MCL4873903.1 FMN-binding protein [bacterium]